MNSRKSKTLVINTLLLIFCVVVIALFCFMPTEKEEIVVLQTYNVAFDSDGGEPITSIEVKEGELITQPDTPVREGYIFTGWTLNGEPYDFSEEITGDVTLKATWEEKKPDVIYYTVTFDSTGGSLLTPLTVASGDVALRPGDPVMDGYIFKEWQLNGVLYDFTQPVTSDITLVAVWEEVVEPEEPEEPVDDDTVKYTVKFNSDGGSKVKDQTVKEGGTAKKPSAPTKNGYIFKSWQLDGKDYNFSTKVTKDITLKATWEKAKVTYTVKFDSKGGSSIPSQTVAENGKASTPSVPKKTGYMFSAWYYNGKEFNFNSTITSNITLTAQWVPLVYKVTIYGSDDKTICDTLDVNYGSTVKASSKCSTSKDGYNFVGYNTKKGATSSNFTFGSTKVTGNITLYQVYKAKTYKVGCTPNTDATGNATTCTLYITEDGKTINVDAIYINNRKSSDSINISKVWNKIDSVLFDYGDLKNHKATK